MLKFILFSILIALIQSYIIRYIIQNKENRKSNYGLIVFSVILVFYIGEIYMKFFFVKSYGFAILGENFNRKYYKYDLYGYRKSNLPLSKEKDNIIVVGDSFVFGHGLKNPEDRFSDIIQKKCNQYHIVNIGKRDLHTIDEIKETLSIYEPNTRIKYVILSYVYNDIEAAIPLEKNQFRQSAEYKKFILEILSLSELFLHISINYLYPVEKISNSYYSMLKEGFQNDLIFNKHITTLRILGDIVSKYYKAELKVLVWPQLNLIKQEDLELRKLQAHLKDSELDTIFLLDEFRNIQDKNLIVNEVDFHPNEFAHKKAAEVLIKKLNLCDAF